MDILPFLVDKLWQNGIILIREIPLIPANTLGVSCHIWNIFGITFEPETLETQSRALKTHILAKKPKILRPKILAHWIG